MIPLQWEIGEMIFVEKIREFEMIKKRRTLGEGDPKVRLSGKCL